MAKKATKSKKRPPPWDQPAPRGTGKTALSPASRRKAQASAQRAGRPYPSLVDNMNAAKAQKSPKTARKRPAAKAKPKTKAQPRTQTKPKRKAKAKREPRATASSRRTRDPRGGLTAAGRAKFARKDGAALKPGVKKPRARQTPQEMRRKGSWARRFYGRKELPPLTDERGRPTRFALTAAAWGEPVPRTVPQARTIAKKGQKLLEAYNKQKSKGR